VDKGAVGSDEIVERNFGVFQSNDGLFDDGRAAAERRKITSELASSTLSDLSMASPARMDSAVGVGCPPRK